MFSTAQKPLPKTVSLTMQMGVGSSSEICVMTCKKLTNEGFCLTEKFSDLLFVLWVVGRDIVEQHYQ